MVAASGGRTLPAWAAVVLASARQAYSTLAAGSTADVSAPALERALHRMVPTLGGRRYKGQSGKVGVVGGSLEYTGAPFYAAMSALKLGADLSHVFCDVQAGTAIKSYSPELIVHPVLRSAGVEGGASDAGACAPDVAGSGEPADEVIRWFRALDALVVGPGLGRDPRLLASCALVLRAAAAHGLPTVVDADGLRLVLDEPEILRAEKAVFVLTPNRAELERMYDRLVPADQRGAAEGDLDSDTRMRVRELCARLGPNVTLVAKGTVDLIFDGSALLEVRAAGAPKRSGGQGDVLAGALATMLAWGRQYESECAAEGGERPPTATVSAPALASYGACMLTRRFARAAYAEHRRSMTAPDLIATIGPVFEEWHPAPELDD